MKIQKTYGSLCKPAQFYLLISVASFVLMLLQNIGARDTFTLGTYSVPSSNPVFILVINAVYIVAWTWLLNMICKINPKISWVIVLFPFVLFFLALALLLFTGNKSRF